MNETFAKLWLSHFPFETKEDLYVNLYIRAIIESYKFIDKSFDKLAKDDENKIRNRFYWDLTERNPITKEYVDLNLLKISFEDWTMVSELEHRRVDLTFFISCFGSFEIECKIFSSKQTVKGQYLSNGLIRFIELKYSKNDNAAGMMGFVVSDDTNAIFDSNIKNAETFHPTNPKQSPQNPIDSNWKHGFISFHERTDKSEIKIYHLLFEFKG